MLSESDDGLDDIPLSVLKLSQDVFGVQFSELVKMDNALLTRESAIDIDWIKSAGDILAYQCEEEDEESSDTEPIEETPPKMYTVKSCGTKEELKGFFQKMDLLVHIVLSWILTNL